MKEISVFKPTLLRLEFELVSFHLRGAVFGQVNT